jgi:MFS family permease
MRFWRDGLWQHRDFRLLWAGQTVSVFGSLTTRLALPFTAVIYLDAPGWQVALLTVSDVIAGIAFGLIAGVWVDRLRRRPIMITADLLRAAVISSVPVVALFGGLHIAQLYVVAFIVGILTTFFDVSYQSYLPTLVEKEELVEGNSKLTASAAVAEAGSFASAGWMVQALTAPGAMLIDAATFLFSAGAIWRIKSPEPPPAPPEERESLRTEIAEGLNAIRRDRLQVPMMLSWMAMAMSNGLVGGVIIFFVTNDLGFSPGVQGVIYGVGGVTSFLGALVADNVRRRLGAGGAMIAGLTFGALGILITASAPTVTWLAVIFLVATQIVSDPGWTVFDINLVSLRQSITPERVMGRVNSAVRFSGLVATLTGALITAALIGPIGARAMLFAGAAVTFSGALALFFSAVRRADAPLAVDPTETLTHAHIVELSEP